MIENLVIKIGDTEFTGWKNFSLVSSVGKVYNTVTFEAVDAPNLVFDWLPSSDLVITSNNDLLFTGKLDKYTDNISNNSHTTTLTGRSNAAVLADSSPTMKEFSEAKGVEIRSFLNSIMEGYNIEFEIQGETSDTVYYDRFNNLSKVEREINNGLFSLSAATVIPSTTGGFTVIVNKEYRDSGEINHVTSGSVTIDETKRYYKYEAVGSGGFASFLNTNSENGEALDDNVQDQTRFIRKRVSGSQASDRLGSYAEWMKNNSYALSRRVNIQIVGWRNNDDIIFEAGDKITLASDNAIIDRLNVAIGEWIIESITYKQTGVSEFSQNIGGTVATMQLIKPEAFDREENEFNDGASQVDNA